MNTEQLYYLNTMGIDVYQLRDQVPAVQWPLGYQFALYAASGKQVAWSLVQAKVAITDEEINLHEKICQALKLTPSAMSKAVVLDWSVLKAMPIIIAFGGDVLPPECVAMAAQLRGQVQKYHEQPYLVTNSLAAMQQDPSNKKRVWQELQLVRNLI